MNTNALDVSANEQPGPDSSPLRFVTAASLFDGHDAAINIMRRLIQSQGAEVIHLGHNRSVEDVVRAALQEDADAIALSSYQGGHVEYLKYMVDMLKERGAPHIKIFAGGGGTITPEEIRELQAYGVERIYHPNDGMKMGLVEMIEDVVKRAGEKKGGQSHFSGDHNELRGTVTSKSDSDPLSSPSIENEIAIGRVLSEIEDAAHSEAELSKLRKQWQLAGGKTPVIGITGTGGAGKSSVTDELLNRFLASFPQMRIAVISVDPTRRRSGGALLGDRIRMNSLRSHRVYMRSMATRRQNVATNAVLKDCIGFLKGLGYDLVIVETAGIGQSDSEIVDLVNFPMYVMTSDYGAASQLEKIDMIDFAELIVLNKYDKRGAEDALRDIRKQWKRNRVAFQTADADVPVYPTIASQFNDPGISWMFSNLCRLLRDKVGAKWNPHLDTTLKEPRATVLIPGARTRYLSEIAEQGRSINRQIETQAETADRAQSLWQALSELGDDKLPPQLGLYPDDALLPLSPTPLPQGARGSKSLPPGAVEVDSPSPAVPVATNQFPPSPRTGEGASSLTSPRTGEVDTHRAAGEGEIAARQSAATITSPPAGEVDAQRAAGERGIAARQAAATITSPLAGEVDAQRAAGERAIAARQSAATITSPPAGEVDAQRAAGEGAIAARQAAATITSPLAEEVDAHRAAGEGAIAARQSAATITSPPAAEVDAQRAAGEGEAAGPDRTLLTLRQRYNDAIQSLTAENLKLLRAWPARLKSITDEFTEYQVRDKKIKVENYRTSLSHQPIPKIAAPTYKSWGELLTFLGKENLPGSYPYTGGVYPYRRSGEDPIRMFAGEGTPERTNRRFHYLSVGQPAARLSTAFDSVTLYGEDPAPRPDIYGKIGNSGVNVPTLDDMKKLYSGFDLCAPTTSVSMTINGPAPMILAMFMNTAIDQQVEKYLKADDARWADAQKKLDQLFEGRTRPQYSGELPPTNNGLGLGLLGVSGTQMLDAETYERIKSETLKTVRGTVQADILKEDQAQNTCIFSTEFALRMMGDIQQYFVDNAVRNFYSVSISGYHIAEAGANPISQLAFTLSNGFTIVEYYLARGMAIDDFAPNLSFFFSNGMDPEYTVIGRVARRIWARAMRERYGASARSQMMKYHIQTSGRSLHAQEIQFNDIRTTLQALYALFDNCNSLHTNAYDEAITTPTEESVRRAVAIQMIINKELGLNFIENPWQGSFAVDYLTDIVEEAVYKEFEAISDRGGVLGAMDTMYQRGKIQEESMYYEHKKHDGSLPLVGVNTFLPKEHAGEIATEIELIRSTEEEKGQQISNVKGWQQSRNSLAPIGKTDHHHVVEDDAAAETEPHDGHGLGYLQQTARDRKNVFAALMEAVKTHSLGQISHALYDVGGEYRRNM